MRKQLPDAEGNVVGACFKGLIKPSTSSAIWHAKDEEALTTPRTLRSPTSGLRLLRLARAAEKYRNGFLLDFFQRRLLGLRRCCRRSSREPCLTCFPQKSFGVTYSLSSDNTLRPMFSSRALVALQFLFCSNAAQCLVSLENHE